MKNLYMNSEQVLKLNYYWLDEFSPPIKSVEEQSPELIKSHIPHLSTDIWSISLILYEITHGIHPFRGITDYETCERIMKNEKIVFGNYLSDDLIELMRGMFEKNKDFRWYFKEIFKCDWWKKYQTFYGFEIKLDLKEFNSPLKKKAEEEEQISDAESDQSVQFKKKPRRNSDTAVVNSAYLSLHRNSTKCHLLILYIYNYFLFHKVFVGEDGISEHSGDSSGFSGILLKSNKSSQHNSPFTLKPQRVEETVN